MGRRKKGSITYDSSETKTVLGLVSIVAGIFFTISIFTSQDTDNNVFTEVQSLFGKATPLTAAFLVLLGFRFLGLKFPLTRVKSLVAQLLFLIIISGIFTSLTAKPIDLLALDETDGGKIGSLLVIDLLGDKVPTQPATKFILFAFAVILFPFILSLSLKEILYYANQAFNFIKKTVDVLFFEDKVTNKRGFDGEEDEEYEEEEEVVEKASRLGDFNKLIASKKHQAQVAEEEEDEEDDDEPSHTTHAKHLAKKDDSVEVKEGSIGEKGLHQEELKYPDWKLPPVSLLIPFTKAKTKEASIKQNADIIEQILESFAIEAKVEDAFIGPSVIQYALNIPLGIKVGKVANLSENIALALGVDSKAVRIESIPDTTYLGIEVPRSQRDMVRFKEIMVSDSMNSTKAFLPVTIGKDISGDCVVGAIEKMPHLLIAGATGSGKSVLTNSFITSIIMRRTPDEVKLILVDPKQVELMDYDGIPHLLTPVITEMDKVVNALKWAVEEMEGRYRILANAKVRDIATYNSQRGFSAMPYIVIVIDEMADMMMTANRVEAETAIVRIAQKARAVGIHLILATQRPSVNVITGIIKANIPGRVGMSVTSSTDSRVILDRIGAESLMGKGDMLYKAPDKTKAARLQGSNIEQEEITRVVDFIKAQAPEVEYVMDILEKAGGDANSNDMSNLGSGGDLLEQAIRIVVGSGKGSSSFLQRRLSVGFNKAAGLLEELEDLGVVGPANGSKPREVLVSDADEFIRSLKGE